jgi:drug/metabolite transporter (DMT)-like permease
MLATLTFACLDTVTKQLVAQYDVPLVAAIRYAVQLALIVAIFGPRDRARLVTARRPVLALVRGLCLAASACFMSLALQRLPLAETTAIIYMAPLLVVLLAGPVLAERAGPRGWIGVFGGLAGVLMVVRPGSGLDPLGVAFAVANAVTTAAYYLLSRRLSLSDNTTVLLFYAAAAGALVFVPALPWLWFKTPPTHETGGLLLAVGALSLLGHGLLTSANRYAPASTIALLSYTQIMWATLLGWLIFGQRPDVLAGFGILLLLGSGMLGSVSARMRFSRQPRSQ